MTTVIVAFYFCMLISGQEWPIIVGPYDTWEECASVREYQNARGNETDGCGILPLPQDSQKLNVGDIPKTDVEAKEKK